MAVEPVYAEDSDNDVDSNEITGWIAINSLTVRSQDIAGAGEMISLLFEAGGNTLENPKFSLTKATRIRAKREAQTLALKDARAEAEAAANALGMRVVRILLVSDSRVNFGRGSGYIVVTGSRIVGSTVPIEPGQIEVEARYSVEFALTSK